MDAAFWQTRWQEGRIGFHEGTPNAYLVKHHDRIAHARRIFVPLCGKTEDLAYLAGQGHAVVGVEIVEDAVRQFFTEHQAEPAILTERGLKIYRAGLVTVIVGDLFATTADLVGPIDAIYDRAA